MRASKLITVLAGNIVAISSLTGCSALLHPFKSHYSMHPDPIEFKHCDDSSNWKSLKRPVSVTLERFSIGDIADGEVFEILTGQNADEVKWKDGYHWADNPSTQANDVMQRTFGSIVAVLGSEQSVHHNPNSITAMPNGIGADYVIRGSINEFRIYAADGSPDSLVVTLNVTILNGPASPAPWSRFLTTTIHFSETILPRCFDLIPAAANRIFTQATCRMITMLCDSVRPASTFVPVASIPVRDDEGHSRALMLFGDSASKRGSLSVLMPTGDTLLTWRMQNLSTNNDSNSFACTTSSPVQNIPMTLRLEKIAPPEPSPAPAAASKARGRTRGTKERSTTHAKAAPESSSEEARWQLTVSGVVAAPIKYTMTLPDANALRQALLKVVGNH